MVLTLVTLTVLLWANAVFFRGVDFGVIFAVVFFFDFGRGWVLLQRIIVGILGRWFLVVRSLRSFDSLN